MAAIPNILTPGNARYRVFLDMFPAEKAEEARLIEEEKATEAQNILRDLYQKFREANAPGKEYYASVRRVAGMVSNARGMTNFRMVNGRYEMSPVEEEVVIADLRDLIEGRKGDEFKIDGNIFEREQRKYQRSDLTGIPDELQQKFDDALFKDDNDNKQFDLGELEIDDSNVEWVIRFLELNSDKLHAVTGTFNNYDALEKVLQVLSDHPELQAIKFHVRDEYPTPMRISVLQESLENNPHLFVIWDGKKNIDPEKDVENLQNFEAMERQSEQNHNNFPLEKRNLIIELDKAYAAAHPKMSDDSAEVNLPPITSLPDNQKWWEKLRDKASKITIGRSSKDWINEKKDQVKDIWEVVKENWEDSSRKERRTLRTLTGVTAGLLLTLGTYVAANHHSSDRNSDKDNKNKDPKIENKTGPAARFDLINRDLQKDGGSPFIDPKALREKLEASRENSAQRPATQNEQKTDDQTKDTPVNKSDAPAERTSRTPTTKTTTADFRTEFARHHAGKKPAAVFDYNDKPILNVNREEMAILLGRLGFDGVMPGEEYSKIRQHVAQDQKKSVHDVTPADIENSLASLLKQVRVAADEQAVKEAAAKPVKAINDVHVDKASDTLAKADDKAKTSSLSPDSTQHSVGAVLPNTVVSDSTASRPPADTIAQQTVQPAADTLQDDGAGEIRFDWSAHDHHKSLTGITKKFHKAGYQISYHDDTEPNISHPVTAKEVKHHHAWADNIRDNKGYLSVVSQSGLVEATIKNGIYRPVFVPDKIAALNPTHEQLMDEMSNSVGIFMAQLIEDGHKSVDFTSKSTSPELAEAVMRQSLKMGMPVNLETLKSKNPAVEQELKKMAEEYKQEWQNRYGVKTAMVENGIDLGGIAGHKHQPSQNANHMNFVPKPV